MKKIILILFLSSVFISCSKSDATKTTPYSCTTCATQPEAVVANNASSKGIYKGVIIGSTGTIKFDIANNGTAISAILVLDGVTVNLTASVAWVAGLSYVSPFTGSLGGQPVSITFSVTANGTSPTVTAFNLPGHPNASFDLIKESSLGLVECFEGTYSTTLPETGTFNMLVSRPLSKWTAVARKTGTSSSGNAGYGIITNNNLVDTAHNGRIIGTLSADGIDGSFVDNNNIRVTLTGRRSL